MGRSVNAAIPALTKFEHEFGYGTPTELTLEHVAVFGELVQWLASSQPWHGGKIVVVARNDSLRSCLRCLRLADDTDIAGATTSTYTLMPDDAGNEESLTRAASDVVEARPNSSATGKPTITGTGQVGETLAADTKDIADGDGLVNAAFAYRWVLYDGTTDTDTDNPGCGRLHPRPDRRRRGQGHRGARHIHRRRER